RLERIDPDIVVLAGDLTTDGYEWEYEQAAEWVGKIEFPKIVIPGNHDSRNVGYVHFRRLFGDPYSRYQGTFDRERAERLRATGFTVVGIDSSEPDVNEAASDATATRGSGSSSTSRTTSRSSPSTITWSGSRAQGGSGTSC